MADPKSFSVSVLFVDDEEGIRLGFKRWFRDRFNIFTAGGFEEALAVAKKESIDVAVLDISLSKDRTGVELFRYLKKLYPTMIVILITGYGKIEDAVATLKEGAKDYLLKPIDNNKLLISIESALELRELKEENRALRDELLNKDSRYEFVGENKAIREVREKIDKLKNSPLPILLTGESGTGKEVLARYIHSTSNRRKEKFVALNCAAISSTLLSSELFGHEKGAFTGAVNRKKGRFEQADKGHLFLDEIGDMSLENQASLLRVLETQSFERVGGTESIEVDVHVIAATNQDLSEMIQANQFREDLFYRINVVHCRLPSLRERSEDLGLLVQHFIELYNQQYQQRVQGMSEAALKFLESYPWPGNIRELSNVMKQIVVLKGSGQIETEDIDYQPLHGSFTRPPSFDFTTPQSLQKATDVVVQEFEKQMIEQYLKKFNKNQTKTSQFLEIDRKTLARKIQKYQIQLD